MHPHTTMQLAAIRQDELLRAAREPPPGHVRIRKSPHPLGRAHPEQGVRS